MTMHTHDGRTRAVAGSSPVRTRRGRCPGGAVRRPGVCDHRPVSPPVLESALPPRMHHLPAAGLAALAVALLVGLPEVLGDVGRLAAVLVLQLGLVLTWVLVTGARASPAR